MKLSCGMRIFRPNVTTHVEKTHADIPTTPRGENGQLRPVSNRPFVTDKNVLASYQKAAKTSWNKMKRFEEKHEITNKTRQGAKSVVQVHQTSHRYSVSKS